MLSVAWWKQRLYPRPEAYDTVQVFLQALEQELGPDKEVLDIGAGAGELNGYSCRGRVKRIVGVDLDPRVEQNPLLDQGVVGSAYELPFPDASFDLVFAIYVLEHIDDPRRFVSEVGRVLKPGGSFLCLTPNKYHYVPVIASMTPFGFHKWYNRLRGREEDDTFPTHYRMNSRRDLRRQFTEAGFDQCETRLIEATPNYLQFSLPTFLVGAAYERIVSNSSWLQDFRVNVIGRFQKAGPAVSQNSRRAA